MSTAEIGALIGSLACLLFVWWACTRPCVSGRYVKKRWDGGYRWKWGMSTDGKWGHHYSYEPPHTYKEWVCDETSDSPIKRLLGG